MYASINAAGIPLYLPAEAAIPSPRFPAPVTPRWERLRLLLRSANQFPSMQKSQQEELSRA